MFFSVAECVQMQVVDPKVGKIPLNITQNIWRTHVIARAEFGAPGRGYSPTHDDDSILLQALPSSTPLSRKNVPERTGRYGGKLLVSHQ